MTEKPRTVLLLEDQPDHAELLREALEVSLPDAGLLDAHGAPVRALRPPDALVCSLSVDRELARGWIASARHGGADPVIVFARGPGQRFDPGEIGEERATVLDKRDPAFLRAVGEAIRAGWTREDAPSASPASSASSPPITVTVTGPPPSSPSPRQETTASVRVPGPTAVLPGGARVARPSAEGDDPRSNAAIAGLLACDLDVLLTRIAALAGLMRARFPGDAPLQHYVAGLDGEVGRARAMAARLCEIALPDGRPRARRFTARNLVALRAPGWRAIVPAGIEFRIDVDDAAPDAEVVATVLGRALDDLVSALLLPAPVPSSLSVAVAPVIVDGASEGLPGLRTGRYVRIAGMVQERPGRDPALERMEVGASLPHRLARALAGVKSQGGYLDLACDRAGGSLRAFAVFLPASVPTSSTATERRTVLLIEDDPKLRGLQTEMLEADGFVVRGVASGDDALALYRAGQHFDLVLLDFSMPGLDGAQTFRGLKELDPDICVLLVSGSVSAGVLREMLAEGLLGYLPKPFGMRQFLESVRAALRT